MSSYFGRAAKTDTNQAQIVKELRFMGFDVDPVHRLKRLYDLVVTGTPRCNVRCDFGDRMSLYTPNNGKKLQQVARLGKLFKVPPSGGYCYAGYCWPVWTRIEVAKMRKQKYYLDKMVIRSRRGQK